MYIIADSGSTKTTWCLIKNGKAEGTYKTIGLNPYFQTSASIQKELEAELIGKIDCSQIEAIYFYGSGCSSPYLNEIVEKGLKTVFDNALITIEHDLIGAARALCGTEAGIACILGTGSNSCYYDGQQIVEGTRALGYILGDEGGASYIGKLFIKAYLDNELPKDVLTLFNQTYPEVNPVDVLDKVYKQEMPNKYLASFASFVGKHQSHKFLKQLVRSSFVAYMDRHISKYEYHKSVPIHFVGSVAVNNQALLKEVLSSYGCVMGRVEKEPITGLIRYHSA